jgi:hypothetical protein
MVALAKTASCRVVGPGFALDRSALKLDRKDMKHAEQFPTQQEDRDQNYHHCQQLSERETATIRFKSPRRQAEDVQCGEPEDNRPKNVVNAVASTGMARGKYEASRDRGLSAQQAVQRKRGARGAREARDQRCRR